MKTTTRQFGLTAAILGAAGLVAIGASSGCTEVYPYAESQQSQPYAATYSPVYGSAYAPPGYTPAQPYTAPAGPAQRATGQLSPAQIDQLTGPVALYPDPLLAQLLPAAEFPDDVTNAYRYMFAYPNATQEAIDAQPWNASVKAIAHYPSVLKQLADNIEWTRALGAAFLSQPQDVMDSIQHLRALAEQAGSLESTPQQDVLADAGGIEIVPRNPQTIYVPTYDPTLVYYEPCPIYFSPCATGFWLGNSFDWRHHHIDHHDWNRRNWNAREWDAGNRHGGVPVRHVPSTARTFSNRSFAPVRRAQSHLSPTVPGPLTVRHSAPAASYRPPIAPSLRSAAPVRSPGMLRGPAQVMGSGARFSPAPRFSAAPRAMQSVAPAGRPMMAAPRAGPSFETGRSSGGGMYSGRR